MSEHESLLQPQYPGDDSRPTSKKELAGWYSYGWAAEVFTVCGMGMNTLQRPFHVVGRFRIRKLLFADQTPVSPPGVLQDLFSP
jgi:UMF1 family MFS transporter